jgi:hypothetical protein
MTHRGGAHLRLCPKISKPPKTSLNLIGRYNDQQEIKEIGEMHNGWKKKRLNIGSFNWPRDPLEISLNCNLYIVHRDWSKTDLKNNTIHKKEQQNWPARIRNNQPGRSYRSAWPVFRILPQSPFSYSMLLVYCCLA